MVIVLYSQECHSGIWLQNWPKTMVKFCLNPVVKLGRTGFASEGTMVKLGPGVKWVRVKIWINFAPIFVHSFPPARPTTVHTTPP